MISNSPILCDSNQQTDHPSNFLAFNWQDGRVNAALDVEPVAAKNDRSMLKLNLQDANKKKTSWISLAVGVRLHIIISMNRQLAGTVVLIYWWSRRSDGGGDGISHVVTLAQRPRPGKKKGNIIGRARRQASAHQQATTAGKRKRRPHREPRGEGLHQDGEGGGQVERRFEGERGGAGGRAY